MEALLQSLYIFSRFIQWSVMANSIQGKSIDFSPCLYNSLHEYLPTGLVVHIVSVVMYIFYRMGCVSCFCTVIILNIGTDRSEQTVETQIRLLLMEQSDQGLLCLLFCLHLLSTILHCKIQLFQL